VLTSPFKSKSRECGAPTSADRPAAQGEGSSSAYQPRPLVPRPELVRWHRAGFRRYWHWKSNSRGGARESRWNHADPGEHGRPIMFGNQHERLHRGLPFLGIVLRLRQVGDVEGRVAQGDQRFPARQYDRIEKPLIDDTNRPADAFRRSAFSRARAMSLLARMIQPRRGSQEQTQIMASAIGNAAAKVTTIVKVNAVSKFTSGRVYRHAACSTTRRLKKAVTGTMR
jgi:hypothetical protein